MNKGDFEGEKIQTYNHIEFNLNKTNNIGNNAILPTSYYSWSPLSQPFFVEKVEVFSDALLKLIDEIISNAVDIIVTPPSNLKFGKPGDLIKINLEGEKIIVYNNGPGFPLYKEESGIYSVQQALSGQYSSTNYNDKVERIQAGVNGQGSKLTNIYSRCFEVETVCFLQKKKYYQKFENNMTLIHTPVLTDYNGSPYTKISFTLDFDKCCLRAKFEESKNWGSNNINLLRELVFRRAAETQTYLSLFAQKRVYFNDELVNFNLTSFVAAHAKRFYDGEKEPGKIVSEMLKPKIESGIPKNFHVSVIFHDPIQESKKKFKSPGFKMINILNNVVLSENPNYINALLDKLETFLKNHQDFERVTFTTIKRKFPGKLFRNNITFITVGSYPKKYFDFKGQTKTNATFDQESLLEFYKQYDFGEIFLSKFWELYKENIKKLVKPVNKNQKVSPRLYESAQCLKSGKQAEAMFIGEGNTAVQILQVIAEHNSKLSREKYGFFSMQGVPMNAIKASTIYPQGALQSEALKENIGLQSLVQVLGLNYEKITVPRYKRIIITTDQDLIGIGKICSLIIAFFMLYFPHLIRERFIWRYRTPIVRYYKGNTCKAFYSEKDFDNWVALTFKGEKMDGEAKYYKGLGCNSAQEVKNMAKTFWNDLIEIVYDDEGEKLLYNLYGEDTEIRKQELLKGLRSGQYENDLVVKLSEHLNNESIAEQLDNIKRMTPHVIDGLLPCQRKVIAICRRLKGDLKVSGLSGKVTDKMNYGYGEASLQGTIKYMAQIFPGSNRLPLLLTVSDANGSQFYGRTKNPAARYCRVTTNSLVSLFYPLEDDDLLKPVFEEGKPYEPRNYIPILPRILLEDTKSIATGWNSRFIARKFEAIVAVTKNAIQNYPAVKCPDLMGCVDLYPGMSIKIINGKEYCLGSYTIQGNKIIITQLPLGLWGEKIVTSISASLIGSKKKETTKSNKKKKREKDYTKIVASVDNETGKTLRICINLLPGALKEIEAFTFFEKESKPRSLPEISAIEEYFGLYKIFSPNLNFYYKNGLKSYFNINNIFKDWFLARRKLYIKRLKKKNIRIKAEIALHKNTLRFIEEFGNEVDYKEEEKVNEILDEKKFMRFNTSKIFKPQRCSASELKDLIYKNGKFKYILNIKQSAYIPKNIQALRNKIKDLENELLEFSNNSWSHVWLKEIEEFEKKYQYAKSVGWDYNLI